MSTETEKHAPSIEAITAALEGLGFIIAGGRRPFDVIALGNDHARDPLRPDELAGVGWLGVVVDPDGHGFPRLELRVIAHDRGGRVVFAALDAAGALVFEDR